MALPDHVGDGPGGVGPDGGHAGDDALAIALAHLLAHLELALEAVDLDLDADDGLLEQLDVVGGGLLDGPAVGVAVLTGVAHGLRLVVAGEVADLLIEVGARLVGLAVDVEAGAAVGLDGGVVPRGHDLARLGLGLDVELGGDVVVLGAGEDDEDLVLEDAGEGGVGGEAVGRGLGLRVRPRHVPAQPAPLGGAGRVIHVEDEGDVAGL